MAENKEGQEKTEPASAKRLHEARMRGQVAKSQDVTTAAVLLFGGLIVFLFGAPLVQNLQGMMKRILLHSGSLQISQENIGQLYLQFMYFLAQFLLPILIFVFIISFISEVSQVGLKIATKKFTEGLHFRRIFNPFEGIRRILFSGRSIFELVKSIAKLLLLGLIAFQVLNSHSEETVGLLERPFGDIAELIVAISFELMVKVSVVYIIIAVADFFYQRYRFREDMKMTRFEVREEQRQTEGDPKVRQRLRSIMRQRLRRIMLKRVRRADVVITNPTHYAVALVYKQSRMNAPKVVAKGVDFLAQKIRDIAKEADVPVVEEPHLARALYYMVQIDQEIPEALFKAVAQVLAYVYHLKSKVL